MKKVIISLGGSLIYPKELDKDFLEKFKSLIEEYVQNDFSFVIFCGGGRLARNLQSKAVSDKDKDLLGIEATKQNASYVQSIFNLSYVYEKIVSDPTEKISTDKKIIICSGWKPGWSTDHDAVLMAENFKIDTIINMSNIDHVYTQDPKENEDAEPIDITSWDDFKKLVGSKWTPGLNMPFDPIATQKAADHGFTVLIIGKDLNNLRKVLDGKDFEGTTIR